MNSPKLNIEFFNHVPEFKEIQKLKEDFQEALDGLQEYNNHVHKLGIFISHKFDKEVMHKANLYTGVSESEVWITSQGHLMVSYFYNKVQSIVVFFEDYVKASKIALERTILHELTHAICGHKSGLFKSPGYFNKLPREVADSLRNRLINYQQDYEVDSYLAKRYPEVVLKYIYDYSKELSLSGFRKVLTGIPKWAHRLEMAIYLVAFYQNLLVLRCIPSHFHSSAQFKRSKRKFESLFRASRIWLKDIMSKSLPSPEELISVSDFKDQFKLKMWFCRTVELDIKGPRLS